jgi:hypothetical protein
MAASSGFYSEALNLLHQAMHAISTGAQQQPLKWPGKWVHVFDVVLFAVALAAAGVILSK